MAGMQFQFDEKGGTFYYFLLSFMALVLFPITYYLWPKKDTKENQDIGKNQCQCEPCLCKRKQLLTSQPWKKAKSRAIKVIIILSWVAFAVVAYKASQVEIDYKEFDPYAELEIDRGATTPEIRRAYRKLSMIYHPDKETGDSVRFMRITKAHAALTDDEARENWEKYGNPDGPGATHFGIALPQWIVEKQNSMWVLAVYALVFMVIMPVLVGTWWYRSIKYSAELILMDTTRLYYVFLQKTPNMIIRRVVMILASSFEFNKNHNNEVVQRPSDNEDLPRLMKDLPNLGEKNKETPLCWPFSLKARALLHSHFARLDLPDTLQQDKNYILAKCPYLLNEMINMAAQLVAMAHSGRGHMPRLETVENMMKVSQMTIQALWESKSPLLQLPHITEDLLRHFVTKRRNVKSIEQFMRLKEDERRSLLRSLGDHEYRDVMIVCRHLPHVTLNVCSEVLDDEDSSITAGSIVTVTVNLVRTAMGDLYGHEEVGDHKQPAEDEDQPGAEEEEDEADQQSAAPTQRKLKVWEKQKKKKGGKTAKSKKKQAVKQLQQVKKPASPQQQAAESKEGEAAGSAQGTPNGVVPKVERKSKRRNDEAGSTDDEGGTGSEEEGEAEASSGVAERDEDHDDDDSWEKFQKQAKKDGMLETKSKETHVVHSPHFPCEKYEWWWLYVADKKSRLLITAPVQVCSLRTEEQVEMKFSAPKKPGIYTYTVILRSDSFVDLDKTHNIKLDVKEAKAIENVKQWDFSDDEEDKADDEESDITTDDDVTDED